jgi:ABC-type branched-subunit amino acid transport system permease subunit
VGGQGTLIGPLLAAIGLKLLENQLRGISADGYVMALAALFMLAVIFLPKGIAGLFADAAREVQGRIERPAAAPLAARADRPSGELHG